MKKTFLTAAFLIFGSLFLSSCRDTGSPFNGTWYEQEPDGCTITISGNSLALSQPPS